MTAPFEILTSIPTRSASASPWSRKARRARPARVVGAEIVPGARLTGKVERHETFGVFVFLAPGRPASSR